MKMTIYLKLTWSIPFYTQQSKSAAIKQTLVQSEIVSTFSLLTLKKLSIDLENVFARFNLPSRGSGVSRPLMVNQVNTLAN